MHGVLVQKPEDFVSRVRDINRLSSRSVEEFLEESILGIMLPHFCEFKPVRIDVVNELVHAWGAFNYKRLFWRRDVLAVIKRALDSVIDDDRADVCGYSFSFAPPGYCFLTSGGLKSVFFKINENEEASIPHYVSAIGTMRASQSFDTLVFVKRRLLPGVVTMLSPIVNETSLPAFVWRNYVRQENSFGGGAMQGKRLCAVSDYSITGRTLLDLQAAAVLNNCKLVAAISFFDFEQGAEQAMKNSGVDFFPIIRKSAVISELSKKYGEFYNAFPEHPIA